MHQTRSFERPIHPFFSQPTDTDRPPLIGDRQGPTDPFGLLQLV